MKNKYAFLLMGPHYNPDEHCAYFETGKQVTYICTVRNFEEAYKKVVDLQKDGVGAIELCGAFGESEAQKIIDLTNNEVAIGFVVHKPEQDSLFDNFFSKF